MKRFKKRIRKILGKQNVAAAWTKNKLAEEIKKNGYEIGDYTYGHPKILWWTKESYLKIGRFCSFGEGIKIYLGGNHHTQRVTTYPFGAFHKLWGLQKNSHTEIPKTKGGVTIGSDVWVADNATIMSGVTIGHGAVIANCAVVTKDVPPYSIAAGNPAKIVKKRFDDDTISQLLKTQWWNLDKKTISKLIPFLLSENIDLFLNECKKLS